MADDLPFPTGAQVIEENRNGQIGKPVDRVDGWAKVTGGAAYSYEIQEVGQPLYGFIVGATIGKGRAVQIDAAAAKASPGVVLVMTHEDTPPQAEYGAPAEAPNHLYKAKPVMRGDAVRFFGDPVAFVVADSFENARAAAALVSVRYEVEEGIYDFEANLADAYKTNSPTADSAIGDFDGAFAAAPIQLDETYSTPPQIHAQMEPHASLATWNGDKLILFTSTQLLKAAQRSFAETLLMPRENVRIVSRYIGGGFGGKLAVGPDAVLSAMASKILGRPVKTAMTRQQMFAMSGHRPQTLQRVRLGAEADGRLTAIAHEGTMHTARFHEFTESVAAATRSLYAAPNRLTRHRLVKLDVPMADAMRAPGEAVGMLAIEEAMDELACRLDLDPIELRVRNEPTLDPERGIPYSSRSMVACMRQGADLFGWERRSRWPGQVREGEWSIGLGMSASIRSNYLVPSKAGLSLNVEGVATVRQAMTDIGTGTYTILAQIAAEALGLPISQIRVEIGDSAFPPAPGSGGSFGAASAGSALLDAAMNLRREIATLAVADPASPLHGGVPQEAVFVDGAIMIGNRAERLTELMRRSVPDGFTAMGDLAPPATYNDTSQHAHGAHFAEVAVSRLTGEVRLRRMLGVFAAGRILNAKTARSQAIGGMIWGVGGALTEENPFDPRYGSFGAQDLAHYHAPAHADIANLDALFIAEEDDKGNPLKIKGVGELGICGAGAAIPNAIYNAIGVRLRDYPMTPDKVLAGLRALEGR
ncbi:xanthine dehydrogenase family protein molybdopterin-binding subunit [soil metagenome]